MKQIVIVRHAKSEQFGYEDDFNRNLTDRGINDSENISKKLLKLNIIPELVFASPANRTMQTAEIFCRTLNFDVNKIKTKSNFYEGVSTRDLISLLNSTDNEINTIYIFGHNPTVYYWVYNLVKHFNADMPTCSTVVINFECEKWSEISARNGEVSLQLTPKSL